MEPNYTLDHYDDDFEIRFLPGFHVPIKQLQFSRQEMDDEVVKHCDFLRTKFLDLAWIACMYIRNKLIPKSMLWKDLFIEFLWMRKFDTYETFRQDFRSKVNIRRHKSRVMRKPDFCLGENKGADQLRGNREADQRLCFRYSDSTIPLLLKSEISSF